MSNFQCYSCVGSEDRISHHQGPWCYDSCYDGMNLFVGSTGILVFSMPRLTGSPGSCCSVKTFALWNLLWQGLVVPLQYHACRCTQSQPIVALLHSSDCFQPQGCFGTDTPTLSSHCGCFYYASFAGQGSLCPCQGLQIGRQCRSL